MNKRNVYIGVAVLVIALFGILYSNSSLNQGNLSVNPTGHQAIPLGSPWYLYGLSLVSLHASPVTTVQPTVVVSEVPSKVGPSTVTSKVPSMVPSTFTTAVASAVAAQKGDTVAEENRKGAKKLTSRILEQFAKDDFRNNPKKYVLSNDERQKLIDL